MSFLIDLALSAFAGIFFAFSALISPVCQGSLLAGQYSVWFGNPANKKSRADFTVRKSEDNGQTWSHSKLVSRSFDRCGCKSCQRDTWLRLL